MTVPESRAETWIREVTPLMPLAEIEHQLPALLDESDDLIALVDLAADLTRQVAANTNGAKPATPSHSWTPVDLLAVAAEPPSRPTISGLAYPRRRHIYSGDPETLKSWMAVVLSAEEIRAGHTVVYVDFEMGQAMMLDRLRDLDLSDEEIGHFLYLAPSEPLTDPRVLADIDLMLAEPPATSLVVFDASISALELHGLDPNSGVEIERFYRQVVAPFQEHGAAVILLDHLPKDRDRRGKFSIGSERKLGGVDVHLGFELIRPFGRGKSGLAKIVTHKDRPGHLPRPKAAEVELTSDPETGLVTWVLRLAEDDTDEHAFRPTHLMEKVSRYIGAHVAGDLPSRNAVETNVTGKRDYVRQAINLLIAENYIAEETGPRNARLLRSVKPYSEADDHAD